MPKPLDVHIEIINKKFPKYVPIQQTSANAMRSDSILFKKKFSNHYCHLELTAEIGRVAVTLFKCDSSDFDKVEDEFIDGFRFFIRNQADTLTIIDTLC